MQEKHRNINVHAVEVAAAKPTIRMSATVAVNVTVSNTNYILCFVFGIMPIY